MCAEEEAPEGGKSFLEKGEPQSCLYDGKGLGNTTKEVSGQRENVSCLRKCTLNRIDSGSLSQALASLLIEIP